jgi:hypothetical protein
MNITLTAAQLRNFWDKVDKSGECWLWTGCCMADFNGDYRIVGGYGLVRIQEKTLRAHRVSYLLHYGPFPDSMCVLHRCDNRACVNPAHLFLGTYLDNKRDCMAKGRHWPQLFSPEEIVAIRASKSLRPLARELGVTPGIILNIRKRITYAWVP